MSNEVLALIKSYLERELATNATVSPSASEDTATAEGATGVPIIAIRRDEDTSSVDASGDYEFLHTNQFGRLKVSSQPAAITATTGTITANAQTVSADVQRASNCMVLISGTYAGVNITFEASIDSGTSWFIIQAVRSDANTIETTSGALTNTTRAWEMSVNAMTNVRVRATGFTSGTANIRILPGVYATEPIPAVQPHGITGTVTTSLASTTLAAPAAALAGGTVTLVNSAASTNATSLKASQGRLLGLHLANNGAAFAYFKLFNLAVAPTVGTSTPVAVVGIPPNGNVEIMSVIPQTYATGIAYAITGGAANADTTAVLANQVVGFTLHV